MATRSPTENHSYWGSFLNAAALPSSDPRLQSGDTAYAQTEASLYVYDGAAWQAVGGGGTVAIASERWVTTGGNDITGDGSLSAPYATVGAALASITTASPSSRWAVRVAAGAFTEAAPLLLKPNVFLVGEDRNATRITAPSVSLDASWAGAADDRSGFANLTLIGACTFDFAAVTSSAGKLYANNTNFNSAVSFNGFGAINQTVFFTSYFFGTFTTSGVNHGAHVACVHGAVTLNQHPTLPSIINAIGGSSGTMTLTTTVTDFARRCSVFAKNFWMEPVTVDGPSSYLDTTVSSLPSGGATLLNGGNLVWIDKVANRTLSNLQGPTSVNESLVPDTDSSRYLGDFGKQWLFTFNYVLTSTGTDLYIITTPSSFGPSPGHAIFVQPDSYGLATNANGGNVEVETVPATGTGNSGSIVLKTGAVDSGATRGDLRIDVNETDLTLVGPLNVNAAPGTAGDVLTSQGAALPPIWAPASGGGSVTSVTASAPLASSGGATPNVSLTGTVGVANGGTGNSASPANGQLLIGNGSGFTLATLTAGAGTTITNTAGGVEVAVNANAPQSIVLDATATGGTATIIGTIYVPAARTLNVSPAFSLAYIGGSLVGDTTTLTLNPAGGGAAVATWTRTGTLGSQTLTSGGAILAAGWYDLTLQGTAGSGVAFARGLYLA